MILLGLNGRESNNNQNSRGNSRANYSRSFSKPNSRNNSRLDNDFTPISRNMSPGDSIPSRASNGSGYGNFDYESDFESDEEVNF